jgi:fructose-1,6-bisphosphatase/sedoheptulose 1,7-bisphosphatase-like protein
VALAEASRRLVLATETLVMRSRSGTIRRVEATHNFEKRERYTELSVI